jgi:hypothetical protein
LGLSLGAAALLGASSPSSSSADVAASEGTIFIRQGKGKRDRVVPIGARALRWLAPYRDEVRPAFSVDEAEDALFLSESGAPVEADTLTRRVGRYFEAAELGRRDSCHVFCHTTATVMLEGGADVRLIQEILGHASLESTEVYTRVSIRHLSAVHAGTHPAERAPRSGTSSGQSKPADIITALEAEGDEEEDDGNETEVELRLQHDDDGCRGRQARARAVSWRASEAYRACRPRSGRPHTSAAPGAVIGLFR